MSHFVLVRQQDETDCGAACLATVAKYYGKRISVARIRNLAGTDAKGTSGKGIVRAAELLGLSCKGVFAKNKSLDKGLRFPIITHIKRNGTEHYIVIYKIRKKRILVADPAKGILWESLADFYGWWSGIFFVLEPLQNFERTNETKGFFERFLYLFAKNKALMAEIFIASFILTLFGILGAFYFRFLIDDVIYSSLPKALVSVSLGYLVMLVFQSLLNFCRNHLVNYFGNKIEASLILEYFDHILHLPLDFFTKRKSGEILSRLGDISSIKNAVSAMTVGVILDCIMLLFGGIVLFTFSPKLVGIASFPVILSAMLVLAFSKFFRRLIYRKSVLEAEKYSHFVESVNGIATIKALCTEADSYDKAELKVIDAVQKGFDLNSLGNIQGMLQNFLSQAGNLAVYWYGSYLIMQGALSLGELISFVTLLGYFLTPLGRLITLQPQLQELGVAGKRLGEILDLPEEDTRAGHLELEAISGNISIKNLSFSYGTRGNTLEDINIEINAGEKVAFVGPSGSGKTTLVKLILKFYEPDGGAILLDGHNIKDFDTKFYRSCFGYVPQEILLFSGTVEENIAWGNDGARAEDIFNAAKDSESLEFISRLPERFATKIGEKGASLSGGERQRLAIARILLRKPKILVLDEATSNLDSLSENAIMRTIGRAGKNTTTLIVAHRLSAVKGCDKIFVLQGGRIVQSGTHEELVKTDGVYSQMWKNQHEN